MDATDRIIDRAKGALVGLAIGDAIGTTLEFRTRDTFPPIEDMVGGGPFALQPGEWTDDTAMALALADSLIACDDLNATDLMNRFVLWRDEGQYSCTGECFDIGATVNAALRHFRRTGDPYAGSVGPDTAGNGSLMRIAPVPIRYWHDREKLTAVAADQSRTTHGAAEAVGACIAFAEILADTIAGRGHANVVDNPLSRYPDSISAIVRGSWRHKTREQIGSSGYVVHSLEAALWSVGQASDFRSTILIAANLGEDADTTAAITGQLAGALYGVSAIPAEWLDRLAWAKRIEDRAHTLALRSLGR